MVESTEDDHPSNMVARGGYLLALAHKLEGMDKEMVTRAARSLLQAGGQREEVPEIPRKVGEPGEAVKEAMSIINYLPDTTNARIEEVKMLGNAWLVVVSYRRP